MNSTVKTLLILGVVVGGAGAAYYFWQKNKKTTAPVVAVTNGNPNASAGSGLASNINAATGALAGVTNALNSFGVGAA